MNSNLNKMLSLCKDRELEWPKRGPAYFEFKNYMNCLQDEIANHEANFDFKKPENDVLSKEKIFIYGAMKTGTSLILNLLDGHPELACMPVDAHILKHYFKGTEKRSDVFKKIYDLWFRKLISPTGRYPFLTFGNDIIPYQNFASYLKFLIYNEGINHFNSFDLACLAYIKTCPYYRQNKNLKIVEKTPENDHNHHIISLHYPEAKYIHIVRNPVVTIASLKKNAINLGYDFNIIDSINSTFQSLNNAYNNINNKNYYIVRYEDLTDHLDEVIKNICKFLKIKDHKILRKPTLLGSEIMNNSMFKQHQDKKNVFIRDHEVDIKDSLNFFSNIEKEYLLKIYKNNLAQPSLRKFMYG
jgi:protein-tyrosine sulfotransferase